jgi:hypothetical protein
VEQPTSEDWEINRPQASERPPAEAGSVFHSAASSVGNDLVGLLFFLLPEIINRPNHKNEKKKRKNLHRT